MDWGEVSVAELLHSLRTEVDWGHPRSAQEFLQPGRWTLPGSVSKWTSRLKANAYHFRANYLLILSGFLLLAFVRRPSALVGVLALLTALLCTNDSTAAWLNDQLLRLVRRVHAPTALKIRARTPVHSSPLSTPHAGRRRGAAANKVFILAVPRAAVVAGLLALALLLLRSSAWTLGVALLLGVGVPLAHATFRSPNLKVKLANAADDFKHMWRGYQTQMMGAGGLGGNGFGPAGGASSWGSGGGGVGIGGGGGFDYGGGGGGGGANGNGYGVPDYTR